MWDLATSLPPRPSRAVVVGEAYSASRSSIFYIIIFAFFVFIFFAFFAFILFTFVFITFFFRTFVFFC